MEKWKEIIEQPGDLPDLQHTRPIGDAGKASSGNWETEIGVSGDSPDEQRPRKRPLLPAGLKFIAEFGILVAHGGVPQIHDLANLIPPGCILAAGTTLGLYAGSCDFVPAIKRLRQAPCGILWSGAGLTLGVSLIQCTHRFDPLIGAVAFSSFLGLLEAARESRR